MHHKQLSTSLVARISRTTKSWEWLHNMTTAQMVGYDEMLLVLRFVNDV
jgi:hypothetical protein